VPRCGCRPMKLGSISPPLWTAPRYRDKAGPDKIGRSTDPGDMVSFTSWRWSSEFATEKDAHQRTSRFVISSVSIRDLWLSEHLSKSPNGGLGGVV
jgi:hypothetical protein